MNDQRRYAPVQVAGAFPRVGSVREADERQLLLFVRAAADRARRSSKLFTLAGFVCVLGGLLLALRYVSSMDEHNPWLENGALIGGSLGVLGIVTYVAHQVLTPSVRSLAARFGLPAKEARIVFLLHQRHLQWRKTEPDERFVREIREHGLDRVEEIVNEAWLKIARTQRSSL